MKTKVAYLGVFISAALVFSYVESFIPINFGIPGIKLGLANIMVVICLEYLGIKEAFTVSVLRIIIAGFLFGNPFMILYSLAGGVLSLCVMIAVRKSKAFSIIGVSVFGGVFHNIGQLLAAMLLVENMSVLFYGPILILSGCITGCLIGFGSKEVLRRMKKPEGVKE